MYEPNNEQIQAVIIADDTLAVVSSLNDAVNETETLGIEIQPLGIYCQKTGALIAKRDENSLFSLIKMHGKDYAIWALYNAVNFCTHPGWIETAGSDLDELMEKDPVGYACYCFGLMTAQFYQTKKNADPKKHDGAERYWSMARANALMTQKGAANLTELNYALCRLVSFMPDSANILFRHIRKFGTAPDTLALLHCTGDLIKQVNDATNKTLDSIGYTTAYIKRTRFVDIAMTPEDAARGPSQVRKQRASRVSVQEAKEYAELQGLFKMAGLESLNGFDGLPGTTKWRAKYEKSQAEKEVKELEMLTDLNDLAEMSNLVFDIDTDDNDNSVEFRTLPASYVEDDDTARAKTVENENNADTTESIENNQIAQDLIAVAADPIGPVMVEIARQVVESLVDKVEIQITPNYSVTLENAEIISHNTQPQKKMTALEMLRAKKGK